MGYGQRLWYLYFPYCSGLDKGIGLHYLIFLAGNREFYIGAVGDRNGTKQTAAGIPPEMDLAHHLVGRKKGNPCRFPLC